MKELAHWSELSFERRYEAALRWVVGEDSHLYREGMAALRRGLATEFPSGGRIEDTWYGVEPPEDTSLRWSPIDPYLGVTGLQMVKGFNLKNNRWEDLSRPWSPWRRLRARFGRGYLSGFLAGVLAGALVALGLLALARGSESGPGASGSGEVRPWEYQETGVLVQVLAWGGCDEWALGCQSQKEKGGSQ